MSLSDLFVDVKKLPDDGYGLFQIFFLGGVYAYVLCIGSNMISDGSELLLLIPSMAGLVGSVVLPVLGAVPDGCIVLFSAVGPDAQSQLNVGIGALAGSTIMLLTIPWFLSVLGGRVDINEGECNYKGQKKLSGTNDFFNGTGVAIGRSVNIGGFLMIASALSYLIIEVPALFYMGETDDQIGKAENGYAMVSCFLCTILFIAYLYYMYLQADDENALQSQLETIQAGIKAGNINILSVIYHELNVDGEGTKNAKVLENVAAVQKKAVKQAGTTNSTVKQTSGQDAAKLGLKQSKQNSYNSDDITESDMEETKKHIVKLKVLIKPFFDKYDHDKSGTLDESEVVACLTDLGDKPTSDKKKVFDYMGMSVANKSSVNLDDFIAGMLSYAKNKLQDKSFMTKLKAQNGEDEDVDEEMPDDLQKLSPVEQQTALKKRAAYILGIGTLLVVLFSDPMVDVLNETGLRTGIPSFYVAFVLAPLASNASEVIASYNYASKKTTSSMAISLSALQGACVMNNTFVLGIFMLLVWLQNLSWEFMAETCSILLVIVVISFMSLKKNHTMLDASLILGLYPLSLVFVATLEACGWD